MIDRPLTQDEFEAMYKHYMEVGGYHFEAHDVRFEWDRYSRGRSWFLYTFHNEHASAVGQILSNRGQ